MAALTTKERNALPNSDFAGPGRSYPVNDASHAANAKARATQQADKGAISLKELAGIKAKADKVLTRGKLKKPPMAPKKAATAVLPTDPEPDPNDPMEPSEGESSTEGM